ncbi:hypothetical protein HPB50_013591 [Hyalomma asiaticum]|uniref:Uncharacterized protein n=1 Tax=Hyalomma asiaticum TaxID=266040 RepID=A0ACB7RQV1_HYAAI|nr:hypothetical protein HPB50_013591 [Hyalomma asiaticum]
MPNCGFEFLSAYQPGYDTAYQQNGYQGYSNALQSSMEAQPMPSYAYLCTVTQPMRSNEAYLPPDGMCDYVFYDSLYKNGKNSVPSGVSTFEPDTRYFIEQASKYSKTKFGLSFAPEYALLNTDYKDPAFNTVIDALWGYEVSHFGFLDLYQHYAQHATVKEALTVLKAIHVHLLPKTSSSRPSYYVVGISFDGAAEDRVLSLMKTVFTPSMYISIAHLSYSNESLSVLRQLDKMGFAIPTAISFSLKGVYYAPRISSPNSPKEHEFSLFGPCVDFHTSNFDDPKTLCGNPDWTPQVILHEMAYSLKLKRMMTYLTESMISTLACDVKQFNLNLNFGIAAYDVDYDRAAPCKDFGFKTLGSSYSRVANTREVMNFFRTNYTKPTDNFVCQMMFTAYDRFM